MTPHEPTRADLSDFHGLGVPQADRTLQRASERQERGIVSENAAVTAREPSAEPTALDRFLDFADAVRAAHDLASRPAYAETCTCGGSVEVGRDVHRTDLRTIHADFLGRHIHCTKES